MENNKEIICPECELSPQTEPKEEALHFSLAQQKRTFIELKGRLIKLLSLIEEERSNKSDISLWLMGFVFELNSSDMLCQGKLNRVIVKINGLCANKQYKTMSHEEIRRQIFEARGILDYLIKDIDAELKK